jgi:hypothetical protein
MKKINFGNFVFRLKLKGKGKQIKIADEKYIWKPLRLVRRIDDEKIIVQYQSEYYLVDFEGRTWANKKDWEAKDGIQINKNPSERQDIYLLNKREVFFYKMKY